MPLLLNCASTERNQADRLFNHGGGRDRDIAFTESLSSITRRDQTIERETTVCSAMLGVEVVAEPEVTDGLTGERVSGTK